MMSSPWTQFDAIKKVRYGPDWKRSVISPPQTVLIDASHRRLADVSWVTPDFTDSDTQGA